MEKKEQPRKIKKDKTVIWVIIIFVSALVVAAAATAKIVFFSDSEPGKPRDGRCRYSEEARKHGHPEFCDGPDHGRSYKPIIYLYPTKPTDIQVKLLNPSALTHTYPKYKNSWNVFAQPNGDLVDKNTNRKLYSLYWEGKHKTVNKVKQDGFVIKGSDTIPFLEEKLEQLGLSEHEAQEFIIYWLPKLESSPYNYIRFQTQTEITKNMPLQITPKPDNLIRVMMEFKNLDQPLNNITEQQLTKPERQGYVVVEWGGTEIDQKKIR